MKFKVIMDSGTEYITEGDLQQFIKSTQNQLGVVTNTFMYLDTDETIAFNPQHISSVEKIEE